MRNSIMINVLNYLWLVWIFPLTFLTYWYHFLHYRKRFINNEPAPPAPKSFVIFQITTRGSCSVVYDVVKRIRDVCSKADFKDYRIDVVTDSQTDQYDAEMVHVPPDFQTPHGSRFKSRALHYNVLRLIEEGDNQPDRWIWHLDEDSFVTQQALTSILRYVSRDNPAPIAEGAILYSKIFEGGPLSPFYQAIIPFLTYNCINMMTNRRIPLYLQGSNLLVRANIECAIGWDFGPTAGEDQKFGFEASLALGKKINPLFDWHGGVIEELPPFGFRSFILQRQRWFIANYHNLRSTRLPRMFKLKLYTRWALWMGGFPVGLVSIMAAFIPQSAPSSLKEMLLIPLAAWGLSYQAGMRLNLTMVQISPLRKALLHLQLLVLTPFLSLFETAAVCAKFFTRGKWTWVLTNRRLPTG